MSARWAPILGVVTAVLIGTAVLLLLATRDVALAGSFGFRGSSEAFGISCGAVGAIVAMRRPENAIGWLFVAIGLAFAGQSIITEYVVASVFLADGALPATTFLAWILTWSWVPPLGIALIFLPLLFPTGRLLSPGWRRVAVLGVVATVAFAAAAAFIPGEIQQIAFMDNPAGKLGLDRSTYATAVFGPAAVMLSVAIVLSMSSLALRFRRATTETRQQIKWFALAALVASATFTIYITVSFSELGSATKILQILSILTLIGLPTAAGMAVLRYRLYDIDRLISRTISYGVMTAVLAVIFVGAILVLQAVLQRFTQGDTVAVAASTLVVFALFQPLRRSVQGRVDRRFDRGRYDADRTAIAFGERMRDQVDVGTLLNDLTTTAGTAVAPESLGLWLRKDGG